MSKGLLIVRVSLNLALLSLPIGAVTCESLAALKLRDTFITAARVIAAGKFVPPGEAPDPASLGIYRTLPTFCRVQGVIQPTTDSHIEFEVWLPLEKWNGKYLGSGNGGFAGTIAYTWGGLLGVANVPGLADLLAGYATSSTDTGHKGTEMEAQWGQGHPELIKDYGYRAIHETAEKSKAIIRAFYGKEPKHSYFSSCSNGGREALMEAQRFPADYDGIISGAPVTSYTRFLARLAAKVQATEADQAGAIPTPKLPAIESAVLEACDALDGLKDGLIDDPRRCHFDPDALLCRGAESDRCLTAPQVSTLRRIYLETRTNKGEQIYPGYFPGGETGANGWNSRFTSNNPSGRGAGFIFAKQGVAYLVFQNPDWDFPTFNLDRDVKIADDMAGQTLNAVDSNLKAFKARGGKLILFHGWSDAALSPSNTIAYYESVVAKMGRDDADSFARLYMVPGMQHCGGGPGPNSFGVPITTALERWVEQGERPDRIIATKYKKDDSPSSGVARTRPLCPYPQVARYGGSGSIDDAANFVCRAP